MPQTRLKKYLKTVLFLIIMLFVFSVHAPQSVQAMSRSAQHKLYKKTMKRYAKKAKASYRRHTSYDGTARTNLKVMYLFVDIDKNGTDELVMRYGNPSSDIDTSFGSGYGESTTIYTIKNRKVVTVLDNSDVDPHHHSNFVHIYKNRSRIDMGFYHGYDDHTFCKYSNGKLYTNKNTITMTCFNKSAQYNQKPISFSAYKAKHKAMIDDRKGYIMKIYQ